VLFDKHAMRLRQATSPPNDVAILLGAKLPVQSPVQLERRFARLTAVDELQNGRTISGKAEVADHLNAPTP
jgi:hypothetical protein